VTRPVSNFSTWVATATLLVFSVLAIAAPWLAPSDPAAQDLSHRLTPPVWAAAGDWGHVFGTDALGRDYLSRLLYGGRISLTVGLLVALFSGAIGLVLGLLGGYFGGKTDAVIMFIITTRLSMPVVLVALAVVAVVGASLWSTVLVLGLLFWDRFAIVIRAATMQLANREFVVASRALGASHFHILFRELLPNLRQHFLAVATIEMSHAILVESALSFLGIGTQPPTPSWGLMVSEGRELALFLPYLIALPGVAIFVLVISINVIGNRFETGTSRRL
jgi:peptide/nickel transport system permease protein